MSMLKRNVFIVGAKRTPMGAFGGSFQNVDSTELAVHASKAALKHAKLDAGKVNSVIFGNVQQTASNSIYLARHVGLLAGVQIDTPSLIVNRLCGSGFQSLVNGAQEIQLGDADIVLTGGTENMSQAPHVVRGIRFGNIPLGKSPELEDSLWAGLTDTFARLPMGMTAENLAEKYNINRASCDDFAFRSQQNWNRANSAGIFKNEIEPFEVSLGRKGTKIVAEDEPPRPQTTIEQLNKLPSVFKKDGTVTAGNASGISDGAAALVLAGDEAVSAHSLSPLARVVAYAVAGVGPEIMGIGPAPAIRKILEATGLTLDQVDLLEVNEAFAPQALAVEAELGGFDNEKFNVCGGAIALGHPLGCSGSRIMTHLTHELQRVEGRKYALGSACIGGGQGIAVLIEKC